MKRDPFSFTGTKEGDDALAADLHSFGAMGGPAAIYQEIVRTVPEGPKRDAAVKAFHDAMAATRPDQLRFRR